MMASLHIATRGATTLPLDTLLSAIPSLPRAMLARLTEQMIDRLDEIDGDTDVELNGNELDEHDAEDAFSDHYGRGERGIYAMPGCAISDPEDTLDEYARH